MFFFFPIFFRFFLWFHHLWTTLFVLIFYFGAAYFWISILVRCLFDSVWKISFEQVHIQSMTLTSSTLQIRRHDYFGDLTIIIFVSMYTLSFYAINVDDVSLFANSFFLFLATLNLYYIDIFFSIWMNEYWLFLTRSMLERILTPIIIILEMINTILDKIIINN